MSLLINLLPDLRQAKLRDRRRRQMVTGISVFIWVVCGGGLALLSIYVVGQKAIIASKTQSIERKKHDLEAIPDLVDALTADQHLAALPSLYDKRVYLTKFFAAYAAANPTTMTLNSLGVDASNLMTISGVAPAYAEVAKLARALEASNITIGAGASASSKPYFTNVSITSVQSQQKDIGFTITSTVGSGVVSGSN